MEQEVVIEVRDGKAHVSAAPEGVQVRIVDHDAQRHAVLAAQAERLAAQLEAEGVDAQDVDELIYDAGGNADINNQGLEGQILFLLDGNWTPDFITQQIKDRLEPELGPR